MIRMNFWHLDTNGTDTFWTEAKTMRFVRIVQESAFEGLCREYGIDTDEGAAILKILLTTAKDINHLLKRKQL
jgi:hypothetical protein